MNMRNPLSIAIARTLIVGILALGILLPVSATQPNNQGCVGESVSTIAKTYGGIGQGVQIFAKNPGLIPGSQPVSNLGQGVQELLAGNIPDVVVVLPDGTIIPVPNTCNN